MRCIHPWLLVAHGKRSATSPTLGTYVWNTLTYCVFSANASPKNECKLPDASNTTTMATRGTTNALIAVASAGQSTLLEMIMTAARVAMIAARPTLGLAVNAKPLKMPAPNRYRCRDRASASHARRRDHNTAKVNMIASDEYTLTKCAIGEPKTISAPTRTIEPHFLSPACFAIASENPVEAPTIAAVTALMVRTVVPMTCPSAVAIQTESGLDTK